MSRMNELLRYAFDEASRQAARLPGDPVAVVIYTFAADGTCAPVLGAEPEVIPMVVRRLVEMLDELAENCHEEPAAQGVLNSEETPAPAELTDAERIAARAIRKAARR